MRALLFLLLCVNLPAFAQVMVTGVVTRVKIPYMSQTEMTVATPDLSGGFLFYREDTSEVYLTTGNPTVPYLRVNPDQLEWSHLATREVDMKQNALDFDDRYKLRGTGTYSEWTALGSPVIRVFGNSLLVRVLSLTYNATGPSLTMEIDAGGEDITPTVEYCLDLTADPQVWTEVENYTLDPAGSGEDGRTTATINPHQGAPLDFAPYYRVTVPGDVEEPEVKLLAHVEISYSLKQHAMSADPADPEDGQSVQWVSDGSGSGDAGDVMMKINVGGTVKTTTLVDFSALP